MDTEASLREYLRVVAKVPKMGHIGPVARAFDFVATAAPGIREILTVGKLCFEIRAGRYDLVVSTPPRQATSSDSWRRRAVSTS